MSIIGAYGEFPYLNPDVLRLHERSLLKNMSDFRSDYLKYTTKFKRLLDLSCKVWYALIISTPANRKREVIA